MVNRGLLRQIKFPTLHKNLAWGALVLGALIAFEAFNYSTTEFAMRDLLGELRFGGIAWSTILALAFCSIDFAGIAHMFSNGPKSAREGLEIWYLFAAWLLAATMNATLTWWGVSIAIIQHGTLGNGIVGRETLLQVVPAFVAVLVWLIRVLIIGSLITSSGHIFRTMAPGRNEVPAMRRQAPQPQARRYAPAPKPVAMQNGQAVAHSMHGGNGNGVAH